MNCRKCGKDIQDGSAYCNWCGTKQETIRRDRKRGNHTGSVYKTKCGTWQASVTVAAWVDADGKRHQKRKCRNFAKKSDAVLALPGMMSGTGGGAEYQQAKKKDMTLHELWDIYIRSREYDALSKSQAQKMGYAWKRWAALEFRGIGTLTVSDIESEIERNTQSYYPAHDMKVCLSHLYGIAIKREIVQYRKTEYADIPYDTPKAKRECWTEAEVDALWKDYNGGHSFTGYILIMCYAGLRYGELATIPLENIDLDNGVMVWGIKSEAGIDREIPIHSRIAPIVRAFMAEKKQKLLEMNEDNFYAAYWDAIRRAGLRELPPHTCRHYFFSRMTAAGVQGGIIAEVGGHASYLTTLKNYVRVPLADKKKAVENI